MTIAFWFFVASVVFFFLTVAAAASLMGAGARSTVRIAITRLLFVLFGLIAAACMIVAAFFAFTAFSAKAVEPKVVPAVLAQACPATPVPVCATSVPDFGPEMPFPAKVSGPAIAELWNPETGFCALVKINATEVLDWKYSGAWWQASSQGVLDVRWPHHVAEYLAKPESAQCQVLTSANQVP